MLEIISMLASVGAFIAAIAAVWTIIEVKRQREATYRPRLVIPTVQLFVSQKGKALTVYDDKHIKFEPGYGFKLQNLGFGSAVNVKIKWIIDYAEIVRRITRLDDSSKFEIDSKGILKVQSNTELMPFGFGSTLYEKEQYHDYIQPEANAAEKCVLGPPELLLNLIRVMLCLIWDSQINRDPRPDIVDLEAICKLPVRILIDYSDISQKAHSAEYGMESKVQIIYMGNEFGEQWSNYLRCSIVCHSK